MWIEDNTQKGMPLRGPLIRDMAKLLHDYLSSTGGAITSMAGTSKTSSPFTVSRGWVHRFKAQYILRNIKLVGECASADHDTAKTFPTEFASPIEEAFPERIPP